MGDHYKCSYFRTVIIATILMTTLVNANSPGYIKSAPKTGPQPTGPNPGPQARLLPGQNEHQPIGSSSKGSTVWHNTDIAYYDIISCFDL